MNLENGIVDMLNSIGAGAGDDVLGQLSKTPAVFNSNLYELSQSVALTAVKPVTSVLLAVIFAIELARVSSRIDGDRELGVKLVAASMFKLALVFIAAQNADLFLKAINQVAEFMMGRMQSVASMGDAATVTKLGDNLRSAIADAGVVGQAGLLVLLLIPFLAAKVSGVVLSVVTFMIFIQLYLMGGFSSLPIAFIASDETKQMGIGFFKRYAQTSLQAVVLWFGILCYRVLTKTTVQASSTADAGADLWGFVISNFGNFLFGSVLLVTLVMTSSQVSKALLGD